MRFQPLFPTALLAVVFTAAEARAQWIPGPTLPASPGRVHAAGLRAGARILALGGTPWVNGPDMDGSVHALDTATTSWTTPAQLDGMGPVLGQGAGIDALGRIVLFGGEILNDGGTGATKVYSEIEGPSTSLANLPDLAPARYFAWTTDGAGRIYLMGGGKGPEAVPGEGNSNLCWRYSASTNSWAAIASMPNGVGDACAVYDGQSRILVIGGIVAQGGARTPNVSSFDVASGTWSDTVVADLPVAVSGARAVVGANGWVYVVGGEGGALLQPTPLATTWIWRPDTNTWSAGPDLATARMLHAAALGADDHVYVFGGEGLGGPLASCEKLFTPPCPTVTAQPTTAEVWAGQSASFTVAIAGGGPLSLQWRRNGAPVLDGPLGGGAWVVGTNTLSITITNANTAAAGAWSVVAANACGSTTSAEGDLVLLEPPSIDGLWIARSLHPSWAEASSANGVADGIQVGSGQMDVLAYSNLAQPTAWTGAAASNTLHLAPASVGGALNGVEDGLKVGWWWWPYSCWVGGQWQTCYSMQACAIESDGAFRNLQVGGWEYSAASATDGVQIAGRAFHDTGTGAAVAVVWNRGPTGTFSPITLTNGWSGGGVHSSASAVYGGKQYGSFSYVATSYDGNHACMWSGLPGTLVDLRPPGAYGSGISGADRGQQCGSVDGHATLWNGSATTTLDIHPAGYASSSLSDVRSGVQVGSAVQGSSTHALVWAGSATRFVDLHARLPATYTWSGANGVEVYPNGVIHVVGVGHNSATARNEALLWILAPSHLRRTSNARSRALPG